MSMQGPGKAFCFIRIEIKGHWSYLKKSKAMFRIIVSKYTLCLGLAMSLQGEDKREWRQDRQGCY